MPTFDLTDGAAAVVPFQGGKFFKTAPITISVPTTAVTNDVIQAVPIKAGWLVQGVIVKMVTAAVGTAHTADIGITGGSAAGFDAAISLKGAAGTVTFSTPSDTYTAAGGFYATANDTVDVLMKSIDTLTVFPTFTISVYGIDTN
jgi:hypothetical protein